MKIVSIQMQPLTKEAFNAYGQILELNETFFPEVEKGNIAIEINQLNKKNSKYQFRQLATHFTYNQTFIPIKGTMILVVAPAPLNTDDNLDSYPISYDKISAFIIETGQVAIINRGTWHAVDTLTSECNFVEIVRRDNFQQKVNINTSINKVSSSTNNIDFVTLIDLDKRDSHIIEIMAM